MAVYNDGMPEPGNLLFSGRDSDIFDYGPALVLRRSRRGRSLATEAKVMRFVGERGYPVPRVQELSADGSSLVMQRIEGPTMLDALVRHPWTVRRQAARLAELHQRLHDIPGPDWLDPFLGGGPCIIHRDLHPLNVIMSRQGPVLIDWANAARGVGSADVALTWLLMTAAEIPGGGRALIAKALRMLFVRSFLTHFDLGAVRADLSSVADWKCQDRNMRPAEVAAIRRLVDRQSRRP
jgi:aminoglycoside phosphotransferase (APT) family kinase protein